MLDLALRHQFPGGGFRLDAAFATPTSGITAVFGPSGCGKSTLLSALAGLFLPQQGHIRLNGETFLDSDRRIALPPERRHCGVVFQDARLFPHLSVLSNLRYGARRAPPSRAGADEDQVIGLLGLGHLLRRRPGALSGGERQRVALGRALLSRPALLLMDEPLAALDAARKAEVLPFLAQLRETLSIPVIYVTHALDEVDELAHFLVLMQDGQVVANGTVEALSTRTDLPLLSHRRDVGAVLPCAVLGHEPARGLSRVGFAGGELLVPLQPAAPGTRLRLRIPARDVSVATVPPIGLSVQNILPGIVASLEPGQSHEALLRLQMGPSILLARVTTDAVSRLGLHPGQAVWALVKSVALSGGATQET